MIISSNDSEKNAVLEVARLMMVAARTAPKAFGKDAIMTTILTGEEKGRLADELEKIGKENRLEANVRDSQNLRNADAVILIGVKMDDGANASLRLVDLGIAIGSMVKLASMLNVDNRIMASVGKAAEELGIFKGRMFGIPLSVKGKNIFFDRKKTGETRG